VDRLPPPEDLRHLSLDTLVEILGSGRPLHEAVLAAKRKALALTATPEGPETAIDPHRRVRTETFFSSGRGESPGPSSSSSSASAARLRTETF
jgi:hypothetical protein